MVSNEPNRVFAYRAGFKLGSLRNCLDSGLAQTLFDKIKIEKKIILNI